jgi:hypothetical protein
LSIGEAKHASSDSNHQNLRPQKVLELEKFNDFTLRWNMKPKPTYRKLKRSLLAVVLMIILMALGIAWKAAPKTSTVTVAPETTSAAESQHTNCLLRESGESCVFLPRFSGETLLGTEITFPDVLTTDYTLIIMLFRRDQQNAVLDWLPLLAELEENTPDLSSYGIPILPDLASYIRLIVQTGFRLALDDSWHDNLVMVFIEDRETFLQAMDIPDYDQIQVFLMDTDGRVLWRIDGNFTETKGEQIREQIALLHQD